MKNNKTICVVVVTHNRKELLLNCLTALKNQTYAVDHIVVVDNASKDDTVEFLRDRGWVNSDKFTLISLTENLGGSGGFYTGTKYAYEQGFDYVWLMDDDGYPAPNCLEKLVPYFSNESYIGPVVLDSESKNKFSFALRIPNTINVIDAYSDIPDSLKTANIIKDIVVPFNGTLIARKLIERMGFIEKDYFIWGDEKEYTIRAVKNKAQVMTIVDALFYHPAMSSLSTPMFFGKLRFNNANSDLKLYCFCRNNIATFAKHYGIAYVLAFWLKTTWFFAFTKPSLSKLRFTWRAMWHGLKKDFSHHREYLS